MFRMLVTSFAVAAALEVHVATAVRGESGPEFDPRHYRGDLDGDGRADVALVVRHPDHAVSVVVFEERDGGWVRTNAVRLEPGARVDRLRLAQGRLTVAYRRPYPVDPPCCPSRETVRSFALVEGRLHGGDHRVPGGAWERRAAAALDAGRIDERAVRR